MSRENGGGPWAARVAYAFLEQAGGEFGRGVGGFEDVGEIDAGGGADAKPAQALGYSQVGDGIENRHAIIGEGEWIA